MNVHTQIFLFVSFCMQPDSTYYIIDMMCWRGYSLYDCNYEFRNFWIKSKLEETGVLDPPSMYHRYQFSIVPALECDKAGLQAAYNGIVPFERDGCLFLNRYMFLCIFCISKLLFCSSVSQYDLL